MVALNVRSDFARQPVLPSTINSFNYNFMCILHVCMYVHKQLIISIPHDEFDFIFHHDFCNLYTQCTVDIELVDACAMYECLDIPAY